jgi:hypothetical protein
MTASAISRRLVSSSFLRRPAYASLRPGGGKARGGALPDHGALELGEGADHLHHWLRFIARPNIVTMMECSRAKRCTIVEFPQSPSAAPRAHRGEAAARERPGVRPGRGWTPGCTNLRAGTAPSAAAICRCPRPRCDLLRPPWRSAPVRGEHHIHVTDFADRLGRQLRGPDLRALTGRPNVQ